MELFSIKTAYTQLRELYSIELQPDQFETMAMIAWTKIGNKMYELGESNLKVDENGFVQIPCEVDEIECVYINAPDYLATSNMANSPLIHGLYVEQYIDMRSNGNHDTLFKRGKLIKYRIHGANTIQVAKDIDMVGVLYKTIKYDEDGFPLVNVKEIDAIAAYCAYAITFKQSIATRDQSTFQMALFLEIKWKDLCSHARTPMLMSQNDFDAIGDVKYSWDRKSYGKTFKPVR